MNEGNEPQRISFSTIKVVGLTTEQASCDTSKHDIRNKIKLPKRQEYPPRIRRGTLTWQHVCTRFDSCHNPRRSLNEQSIVYPQKRSPSLHDIPSLSAPPEPFYHGDLDEQRPKKPPSTIFCDQRAPAGQWLRPSPHPCTKYTHSMKRLYKI